jgi:hypothetical protein
VSGLFIEYALGNTLLAVPLALLAWTIGRSRRYPSLAHLAWGSAGALATVLTASAIFTPIGMLLFSINKYRSLALPTLKLCVTSAMLGGD